MDPEQLGVSSKHVTDVVADYQSTYQYQGGLRNPDGTTPRRSEYAALTANITASPVSAQIADARTAMSDLIGFDDKARDAANNLFKAHKQAIGKYVGMDSADWQKTA